MDVNDVIHRKRAWRILGILNKSVEFCLGRRRLAFACSPKPGQWPCGRCRTRWGTDGKVIIERLCISFPYVEAFNSKVIKGRVPELRSRYVFFVFRDSYVLCIYVMNILYMFPISVSWVCYNTSSQKYGHNFFFGKKLFFWRWSKISTSTDQSKYNIKVIFLFDFSLSFIFAYIYIYIYIYI